MYRTKRKGQITYKGKPIRKTANTALQTIKYNKGLELCISKFERTKLLFQHTIPRKTVIIDSEQKTFYDKRMLRELIPIKLALQRMLEENLKS